MDIIYHTMPSTWKNNIIEQGFNYVSSTVKEMTDFFETREENLTREESSASFNKNKDKEGYKKRKRADTTSNVVESSKESLMKHRSIMKEVLHSTSKMQPKY